MTINDHPPQNPNDTFLYLSEEAAEKLNIRKEGIFPCEIFIPKPKLFKMFIQNYLYSVPIIDAILIFCFSIWQIFS